ncbi:MAG TPA: OmpA family protein [Paracoccaceae bacterium]|nr:OmpA family protein [Paracoccaceae bacterium]
MSSSDPTGRLAALTLGVGALLSLAACETPAGHQGTMSAFGEATAQNTAMQLGDETIMRELSRDFRESVQDTVTFAFDKAALDAAARLVLDKQAAWLARHRQARMTVTGHTDLVGSERYNYGLGLRRAQNVVNHLVARGISRDRLIAVESQGESEPAVPTGGPERQNRRAVTMVTGIAGIAGSGLDGVYAKRVYNAYQQGEMQAREAQSDVTN